ncbi:hypothetical protein E3P84_01132 [Wallemia ichthyophaga]|nr:hypothetical protein E3P84_01132 [Wallemia ichthyophaga]
MALGSLEYPYLSFHAFVRATNATRQLGMADQFHQTWAHWRQTWVVGEVFHLDNIKSIPIDAHNDKHNAFISAIQDVPSSVKIALFYIDNLIHGSAQGKTEQVFSEQSIRQAFGTAYEGIEWDLTGSCEIWDKWRDWEQSLIEVRLFIIQLLAYSIRNHLSELVPLRLMIINVRIDLKRYKECNNSTWLGSRYPMLVSYCHTIELHSFVAPDHADTFSSYSSFITAYDNSQYESHMVAANKDYKKGQTLYEDYDQYEIALGSNYTVEAYLAYINFAQSPNGKPKLANRNLIVGLFERAVRDCYPFNSLLGEDGSGPSGSTDDSIATSVAKIWVTYVNWMINNKERPDKVMNVIERSVKVCPWSGELWSSLIRAHEQFKHPAEKAEETYARAISTGLIESRVDDLVALISARASYLRHTLENVDVAVAYAEVAAILEDGLDRVKSRDPFNRIEKYAISWHERVKEESATSAASQIFERMSKNNTQKRSYSVWLDWAAFETRNENYDKARSVYKTATPRQFIDYPEAVHQAYKEFEDQYGSLDTQMQAQISITKASQLLADRRLNEAAQAYENYTQQQPQVAVAAPATEETAVDPSLDFSGSTNNKRKAGDESNNNESAKKQKVQQTVDKLKRDRENTTVIVSGLPLGCNNTDVNLLFKDCGDMREVTVKDLKDQSAATVEFLSRDDVPAALTKDKKRIEEVEIKVVMGWSSTLYVTNFPEGTKDDSLRALFEPYGTIFDTRWPSRSIKTTRRFAYVTFLDPASAQASLELNGKVQEDNHSLSVAISDPSKRKSRSDDFVNGQEIFVRELGKKITEADLRQLFEPFGAIKQAKLGLRDDGSCKGFAHIEFEDSSSAQNALRMNNVEVKGKHISVTMSNRKPRQANAPAKPRFGRSIRVDGIPDGTKESFIQQTFEVFAPVKKVWYNENGNEGAAVVEFENDKEMSKVMLMQAPSINGQQLSLSDEASHKKPLSLSENKNVAEKSDAAVSGGQFVPRNTRRSKIGDRGNNPDPKLTASSTTAKNPKTQDDFRKFLK